MKRIICAAAIALMASTSHAQSHNPASGIEGSFLDVVAFHGPSGFALIDTPPPLIDYQGHSFQSLTFAITPSADQTYSFDFTYVAPAPTHLGLLKLSAWLEPASKGGNYLNVTVPSANISVAPAFVLGGVTLQTAMVPIAPDMQTPVTVTLAGYKAGITGACIGGLSNCLYFSDPGLLKIQIEMSVTAVPEASTSALMALGLAGIWITRNRRRRTA